MRNEDATDVPALRSPLPAPLSFSDLVSPVVIKELRQGLRTRSFLFAFFLLPGVLGLATLLSVDTLSFLGDGLATFVFWCAAGLPMLVSTAPAFLTLRTEIRSQSVELMLMTELSPWRILLGKWTALAAQFGLMAVIALPFTLVRYFVGGQEIPRDLASLGILLGVCQVLAAAALAFSCWRPTTAQIVRLGLIIVLALPLFGCVIGAGFLLLSSLLARVGLAPLNGLLIALLLLSWAAGRIATETERIYLNVDRKAFYWALMATLTAQAASRLSSLILTGVSAYFHYLAINAFAQRSGPAPALLLPLVPRRWRDGAARTPGHMGLAFAFALTALDLVVVAVGFMPEEAAPVILSLLLAFAGCHLLPRRAEFREEELDAAGA